MFKVLFVYVFTIFLLAIPIHSLAEISCAKYRDNINNLHSFLPKNLSEKERCDIIPDKCSAPGWYFFNPDGMETSYYKSECFMALAISTLEEKYCDAVLERKSIFLDGSYFSRKSCLDKVRQIKSDIAATKVNPKDIHGIESVQASIVDGELKVAIYLVGGNVSGQYALTVIARYKHEKSNSEVIHALNPQAAEITYDTSFEHFHPLSDWITNIEESQEQVGFTISERDFADVKKAIDSGKSVNFEISLQFLETKNGAIADIHKPDKYISKHEFTIDAAIFYQ